MKTFDLVMFRTLGDVLMVTPIVAAIKVKYPDSYIRFHTETVYIELLGENKDINEIVGYENANYPAVYEYLKDKHTDHIARMAMANQYDTCWHHNPDTFNQHMIAWYASRTGLLPEGITDYHIRFNIKEEARLKAKSLVPYESYAIVHTTSRVPSKDWSSSFFDKLVDMFNIPFIQIGSGMDRRVSKTLDLCGKTSMQETLGVMEKATFFVGVDSGPSYMAESLNLPSFIILGSTMATPQESSNRGPFIGPIGPSVKYFEPSRPSQSCCRPITCYTHCQLNKPCINDIIPETVYQSIKETIHVD
jgi:heptosyltransferase-3